MRRVLLIASACVTSAGAAYGQGQGAVTFENYGGVASALVRYDSVPDNVPAGKANLYIGGNFVAELGYFVGTTTDPNQLTLLPSSITTFFGADDPSPLGSGGAGAFQGPTLNIPGVTSPALAANVTFEVFVWENAGPFGQATYAQAEAFGISGHSTLFTMGIGGTGTPPNIPLPSDFGNNLQPFMVHNGMPEPGTLALVGLGAAGLLLFRRRK